MTIRFAAARAAAHSPITKVLAFRPIRHAANDNCDVANDEIMREALYHFSKYGLRAAREAHARAEVAFFRGNRSDYNRWLEICRLLDRRLAMQFERVSRF